ncbi:MAG: hypothetical protein JKP98_19370 [Rhodobacteraceae bacterium]|nr:hypothetical protein [Paracoccaceae bacterium]
MAYYFRGVTPGVGRWFMATLAGAVAGARIRRPSPSISLCRWRFSRWCPRCCAGRPVGRRRRSRSFWRWHLPILLTLRAPDRAAAAAMIAGAQVERWQEARAA